MANLVREYNSLLEALGTTHGDAIKQANLEQEYLGTLIETVFLNPDLFRAYAALNFAEEREQSFVEGHLYQGQEGFIEHHSGQFLHLKICKGIENGEPLYDAQNSLGIMRHSKEVKLYQFHGHFRSATSSPKGVNFVEIINPEEMDFFKGKAHTSYTPRPEHPQDAKFDIIYNTLLIGTRKAQTGVEAFRKATRQRREQRDLASEIETLLALQKKKKTTKKKGSR